MRRVSKDPLYRKLLNEAFARLGMQSPQEVVRALAEVVKSQDPFIHISGFLGRAGGEVTIVRALPSEIKKLMDLMVKSGFGGTDKVRDAKLWARFVKALLRGDPK